MNVLPGSGSGAEAPPAPGGLGRCGCTRSGSGSAGRGRGWWLGMGWLQPCRKMRRMRRTILDKRLDRNFRIGEVPDRKHVLRWDAIFGHVADAAFAHTEVPG